MSYNRNMFQGKYYAHNEIWISSIGCINVNGVILKYVCRDFILELIMIVFESFSWQKALSTTVT